MIISASLSKPSSKDVQIDGKNYIRIKIKITNSGGKIFYFAEGFTQTQAFHFQLEEKQIQKFLDEHAGKTFKNCIIRTDTEEITLLANKKGRITELKKKLNIKTPNLACNIKPENFSSLNKKKNYILKEGIPIPFLVVLGIMTDDGKVISSKYDKFRQINRFLEFIDDSLAKLPEERKNESLNIVDFGSGKSYLTFAVHYFLTSIKQIPCKITGLDLKKDTVDYCNSMAKKLGCNNLHFQVGNISDYDSKEIPDMMITLHACDTATDFALAYAVKKGCRIILSIPCCQHEINAQLDKNLKNWKSEKNKTPKAFMPILKYGLLKERFAAIVTDALRAEYLETMNYDVQLLEFIDFEHTPKNLLIRAVKKEKNIRTDINNAEQLSTILEIQPTLKKLLLEK